MSREGPGCGSSVALAIAGHLDSGIEASDCPLSRFIDGGWDGGGVFMSTSGSWTGYMLIGVNSEIFLMKYGALVCYRKINLATRVITELTLHQTIQLVVV